MGAVSQEIAPVKKEIVIERRLRERSLLLYEGRYQDRKVLLAQTGMGESHAAHAFRLIADRYPLDLVISVGFAGGTASGSATGDLILCDKVFRLIPDRGGQPAVPTLLSPPIQLDRKLIAQASELLKAAGVPFQRGATLTVEKLISQARIKEELGKRYPVLMVEMETAILAETAAVLHIPLLVLRAILDPVSEDLPDLGKIVDLTGQITLQRLIRLFFYPRILLKLLALRREVGKAQATLQRAIKLLLIQPPITVSQETI
ncbi:MAG: hypothetical protein HY731_03870 [Candidatus Tectomicrobia bacterium]|nr:hypothetical protein [Candidatus Tectomicrobia bacterium]